MELSAATVLDALASYRIPSGLPADDGALTPVLHELDGRPVLLVGFDYGVRHGSIGVREADQLVAALRAARRERWAVVLLLETSGIRITDGTAGIASLRRILREAEDARLEGVRMLAVVLRCAFGGASMLASVCERRLIGAESLFGMSGPRLIAASDASASFDAGDPREVRALLGGAARAAASDGFELLDPRLDALDGAVREWLRSAPPRPVTCEALADAGAALARRLAGDAATSAPTACPAALDVLHAVLPEAREVTSRDGLAIGRSVAFPGTRALLLVAPAGTGARLALAAATALLDAGSDLDGHARTTVVVDSPGHLSTPEEERLVLSEYLAHLALCVRARHRSGRRVDVVVAAAGGGGIQGALGSGASSVSMAPTAKLTVLPAGAMRALDKEQRDDEGRLAEALETGAIDAAFPSAA